MSVDRQALCEYIDENRDDLYKLLRRLVSKPSVTGTEADAQQIIKSEFEALGLDPDVWNPDIDLLRDHPAFFETVSYEEYGYEGRPNVAAVRSGSGGGPSLAFSGHIDVVDVEARDWTYDPWDPTVTNGRMYGRGTADMKGGIAAYFHAVKALEEFDVQLAGDLILQSTIEEEAGGVGGVLSALLRGYQPDAAIITEPYGIPNIGIASAGVQYFRITIPGKAAHAARGYKGVNAIEKAVAVCQALMELDQERKERISYEPVVRRSSQAEGEVTNLNLGTIEAGDWPSTVPPQAVIEGRIGWPPGETRTEVCQQVENTVADAANKDEWLSDFPPEIEWFGWSANPHEVNPDEEIVQLAKRHAEQATGGGVSTLESRRIVEGGEGFEP